MRLSTLQAIIDDTIANIELDSEKNTGTPTTYTVSNWNGVHKKLYIFNQIPLFRDSVETIFALAPHFRSNASPLTVTDQQLRAINNTISKIKWQCEAILSLPSTSSLQEENTINIKLPKANDLKELENVIHRIDQSFSQCPIFKENIGLKLLSFDHGSEWIVLGLVVGGAITLKPLADFLKSIFEIRKTIAETEKIRKETVLVDMQIEEKNNKIALEAIEKYEQILLENRCKQIAQSVNPNTEYTPEEIQKLAFSVKTLAILMEEGMEIYPSDIADEETINSFPKKENPSLLSDLPKLLSK